MADQPYMGEYSRLAAQLAARRHAPVQSVGQGLADVLGDVGEAYFAKKAAEKDKKQVGADNKAIVDALIAAGGPMSGWDAGAKMGQYGQAQSAFPTGMTSNAGVDPMAMKPYQAAQPAFPEAPNNQKIAAAISGVRPEMQLAALPMIQDAAQQYSQAQRPKTFSGVLKPGEQAYVDGRMAASLPAEPKSSLLTPEEEAQRIRIAQGSRPAPEPKTPQSKFAYDRKLQQNRSVTAEEEVAEPARYAPPVASPTVKLFNKSGQEIGTGDPNDPGIQARIAGGEVRTAPPRQFSGEQSKAAGFANDALTSEANVEKLMSPVAVAGQPTPKKFDPTGFQGVALSNITASPEYQQYQQAKSNWGMAILRQESGGAITPQEGLAYAETFFPKFGDSKEVVAQKKAQREQKVRGVIAASGGAYGANFGGKVDQTPDGVDPTVWAHMTPEEKSLWAK